MFAHERFRAHHHYPGDSRKRQQCPGGAIGRTGILDAGEPATERERAIKRTFALLGLIAGITLVPVMAVLAQDLPDLPGMDGAQTAIDRSREQGAGGPRSPRAPRQPGEIAPVAGGGAGTGNLPGSNVLPNADRGTRRNARSATARSGLPRTGQDFVLMWLAGLGLLTTGAVLVVVRRRLRAPSAD